MWTNVYSAEALGGFISEARRASGESQIEYAKRLGVAPATLSALETGKNVGTHVAEAALQLLGFRLVVVPKDADVEARP